MSLPTHPEKFVRGTRTSQGEVNTRSFHTLTTRRMVLIGLFNILLGKSLAIDFRIEFPQQIFSQRIGIEHFFPFSEFFFKFFSAKDEA